MYKSVGTAFLALVVVLAIVLLFVNLDGSEVDPSVVVTPTPADPVAVPLPIATQQME